MTRGDVGIDEMINLLHQQLEMQSEVLHAQNRAVQQQQLLLDKLTRAHRAGLADDRGKVNSETAGAGATNWLAGDRGNSRTFETDEKWRPKAPKIADGREEHTHSAGRERRCSADGALGPDDRASFAASDPATQNLPTAQVRMTCGETVQDAPWQDLPEGGRTWRHVFCECLRSSPLDFVLGSFRKQHLDVLLDSMEGQKLQDYVMGSMDTQLILSALLLTTIAPGFLFESQSAETNLQLLKQLFLWLSGCCIGIGLPLIVYLRDVACSVDERNFHAWLSSQRAVFYLAGLVHVASMCFLLIAPLPRMLEITFVPEWVPQFFEAPSNEFRVAVASIITVASLSGLIIIPPTIAVAWRSALSSGACAAQPIPIMSTQATDVASELFAVALNGMKHGQERLLSHYRAQRENSRQERKSKRTAARYHGQGAAVGATGALQRLHRRPVTVAPRRISQQDEAEEEEDESMDL